MVQVFPDYYKNFKCIAGRCRHNCCIGWEIDIDDKTAAFYAEVDGHFGDRLRRNISRDGQPHFILGKNDRCPFLNGENLCDIILTLGEEHICGICSDHPRFKNELPGRVEFGLGLCCEEAARLILGKKTPVKLEYSGYPPHDSIISMRDAVLMILQERSKSIEARIYSMLILCRARLPFREMSRWSQELLKLERLDEKWTEILNLLSGDYDIAGFDRHMAGRQSEYEQLLVYFVYRHMANAWDDDSIARRAAFAALGYEVLHAAGAALWTKNGSFTFEDQAELARMFSSEIEYSDENLDIIFEML
ncbi:MAG: flagellin lysine-N-methylase [Oscillospiraceae bacterium]|nr:flagellin lysine-N-methylase [Oscillospiraceae bacterium]